MLFSHVHLAAVAYELAPHVVTSDDLESRLASVYQALRLQPGQLYALTGIRQRRWWDPGQTMADGAARAGRKALDAAGLSGADLGMLIYAGVCRDHLEPATACAVADALGVRGDAQVYDIANACLGQLNGMIHIASAIEAGHIRAGMVLSCESARQIVELTIDRLRRRPDMQTFKLSLATLTGGSGAAAVLLTHESLAQQLPAHGTASHDALARGIPSRDSFASGTHRLLGGVVRTDPRWHKLCRWGPDTGTPASAPMVMQTDAAAVLEHGVALGVETFAALRRELGWDESAQCPVPSAQCPVPDAQDVGWVIDPPVIHATNAPAGIGATNDPAGALPIEGTTASRTGGSMTHPPHLSTRSLNPKSKIQNPKSTPGPDKVICHQVGAGHRAAALASMGVPSDRDFSTFEYLGNIGTVSLPLTLAMAAEQGFLAPLDRVGLLGIGSGLNCLMLGVEW